MSDVPICDCCDEEATRMEKGFYLCSTHTVADAEANE